VFPAGTGNDFAKSLGIRRPEYLAIARAIAAGAMQHIDVGEIDGVPFVNAAGLGFDVAVVQHMQRPARWLRGPSRYVVTALRHLVSYPGLSVSVSSLRDGAPQPWLTVVFANGQWFGGAFRIAPAAALHSGRLQCVAIGDVPVLSRARLLVRALRGTHLGQAGTWDAHESRYVVTCDAPPMLQVDGELHQARSLEVIVQTRVAALQVVRLPDTAAR
jgi:diacylglycerol kinase (ATP)